MEIPEIATASDRRTRIPGVGYLYVMAAALLWAASGSAAKYLFQGGLSPFQLVQLRTTIASASLFACLLIRKRGLLVIGRKDLVYFFFLGVALAASQATYLYAISRIQVAAAILLQYMSPVLIAAYSVLFARKRLALSGFAAVAGAVAGCYLMVGGYSLDIAGMNRPGIFSGLASAFAFAVYTIKSEYGMRSYSPWTVVFYALVFAAVFWNVFHPPLAAFAHNNSGEEWAAIVFIGVFGTILPFGLYNEGIRLIHATHASITATLEPVIAGIIAYIFLGELMEGWQILGGGLVIASVLLLQIRPNPADR